MVSGFEVIDQLGRLHGRPVLIGRLGVHRLERGGDLAEVEPSGLDCVDE